MFVSVGFALFGEGLELYREDREGLVKSKGRRRGAIA